MKRIILALIMVGSAAHGQGLINAQSGSGVPTDMAIGGLLGAIVAPMISKGSDAKLVGGLLGALAGGAYGTAQQQQAQQQHVQQMAMQQQQYQMQQQQQANWMAYQQHMAKYQTGAGGSDVRHAKMGTVSGEYIQSPYSKYRFHMASQHIQSGDTLYDPQTGQPFRVP